MNEKEFLEQAKQTISGMALIGVVDGQPVFASMQAIGHFGAKAIREQLGLVKMFSVVVDLSGNAVLVAADSQEEAMQIYLKRKKT